MMGCSDVAFRFCHSLRATGVERREWKEGVYGVVEGYQPVQLTVPMM